MRYKERTGRGYSTTYGRREASAVKDAFRHNFFDFATDWYRQAELPIRTALVFPALHGNDVAVGREQLPNLNFVAIEANEKIARFMKVRNTETSRIYKCPVWLEQFNRLVRNGFAAFDRVPTRVDIAWFDLTAFPNMRRMGHVCDAIDLLMMDHGQMVVGMTFTAAQPLDEYKEKYAIAGAAMTKYGLRYDLKKPPEVPSRNTVFYLGEELLHLFAIEFLAERGLQVTFVECWPPIDCPRNVPEGLGRCLYKNPEARTVMIHANMVVTRR